MRQLDNDGAFEYLKELGYKNLTKLKGEPIVEVVAETWEHFIGCVPPIAWEYRGGVETFCVGECSSGDDNGDIYLQLARMDGRFFMRHAYPRRFDSWMSREEIEGLLHVGA